MAPDAGGDQPSDLLAPLFQSLAIGVASSSSAGPSKVPFRLGLSKPSEDPAKPSSASSTAPKPRLTHIYSHAVNDQRPPVDRDRCSRCYTWLGTGPPLYRLPCCEAPLCHLCLRDALNDRLDNDVWCSPGAAQWISCLAGACETTIAWEALADATRPAGDAPHPWKGMLNAAWRAREALWRIRPRPTRGELELAQRLHRALVDRNLMLRWHDLEPLALEDPWNPPPLCPVRSGFLTQSVPLLTRMLKKETRCCTRCSKDFDVVDARNDAAWTSIFLTFPGDWAWLVFGRPSKAVLPECAAKHSLDICPSCLPRQLLSGLKTDNAVANNVTYRFVCPLCNHVFSAAQVEKLARLIDPSRGPVTLLATPTTTGSALSASSKPAVSSAPALPSKPLFPSFGPATPAASDGADQRKAIMSAIVSEKPNVKWTDVAGLDQAKRELQRAIVFPARFPNLFDEKRRPSGAILLYGPPGTGKSYLAKAVATEVDHAFFSISSADIMSKYMGESEKLVRQLFTLARENRPSIIFIDEIDALCSNREGAGGGDKPGEPSARMKTELLVQLDGLHASNSTPAAGQSHRDANAGVTVLAATNLPWLLDPAFRRRFEPRVYIPLPSREARRELFRIHAGRWAEGPEAVLAAEDLDALAALTEGYSGSDVAQAVRRALGASLGRVQQARFFRVVRDEGGEDGNMYAPCGEEEEGAIKMTWEQVPKNRLVAPPVTAEDFKEVLRNRRVKASVGVGELTRYVQWTEEFGVEGSG
ncbi:hypothetical protein VTJ83DRAFT_3290 [Remersonia thermophila]|uniref:AAA+ ATPase domain-containing protein n=1 Tax=Remersonia thermophila TaxID=72144 RepID=A0ABR4DEI1_9PEZI